MTTARRTAVVMAWLACLAAYAAVGVLAWWPRLELTVPPLDGIDKLQHLTAWALLAAASWPAARRAWPGTTARRAWRVALVGLAFGALVELLQAFVPGRSAELGDLLADLGGSALGVGVMGVWERWGSGRQTT